MNKFTKIKLHQSKANKGVYTYIRNLWRTQNLPEKHSSKKKKLLVTYFIVSFDQLVISHESLSLMIFFKLYIFISFVSLSKLIMLRPCFPLNYIHVV